MQYRPVRHAMIFELLILILVSLAQAVPSNSRFRRTGRRMYICGDNVYSSDHCCHERLGLPIFDTYFAEISLLKDYIPGDFGPRIPTARTPNRQHRPVESFDVKCFRKIPSDHVKYGYWGGDYYCLLFCRDIRARVYVDDTPWYSLGPIDLVSDLMHPDVRNSLSNINNQRSMGPIVLLCPLRSFAETEAVGSSWKIEDGNEQPIRIRGKCIADSERTASGSIIQCADASTVFPTTNPYMTNGHLNADIVDSLLAANIELNFDWDLPRQ